VALPDTVAVPTWVPPEVHEPGGEDCGPKTLKVIVPPGEDPPDRIPEMAEAEIDAPVVPIDGALADRDGLEMALGVSLTIKPLWLPELSTHSPTALQLAAEEHDTAALLLLNRAAPAGRVAATPLAQLPPDSLSNTPCTTWFELLL
jgi:hypothetical protein